MTDTTTAAPAEATPTQASAADAAPMFDAERRATELAVLDALRNVVDPAAGY
jgi:hypothetical protein